MAKSKKKKQNTQAPTAFDPFKVPDYSNARKREAAYGRIFAMMVDEAKKMQDEEPGLLNFDNLDLDPVRMRRRKKAALQYVDQVKQLVSDVCPEIPRAFYIEEEWATINALFMPTYDMYEPETHLTYAAALWLLDRIQENGRMEDVRRLLPDESLLSDDPYCQNLYDLSYSRVLIDGVVWIIRNRNSDCIGLKITEPAEGTAPRVFMDDYTAVRRQHQDVPSRQRFEQLLALAGKENLERAAEHYESKLWEIVRLYFTCRKPYTEEERGFAEQRDRYLNMVQQNAVALKKEPPKRKSNVKPAAKKPDMTAPLVKQPSPELIVTLLNLLERNSEGKADELPLTMIDLENEEEDLLDRKAEMLHDNVDRCMSFCECINYSKKNLTEVLGANGAELLTGFDIGDPYEMSVGLLWLIDTDSELPWLYFPSTCLLNAIIGRVPWHKGYFHPEFDSWWGRGYGDDKFHLAEGVERPKSLPMPEPVDWYSLDYIGKCGGYTDCERTNLAQIVYQITGTVMPRNTTRYDDAAIILKRFGITGKRAISPLMQAITMAGLSSHQETAIRQTIWTPDEPEPEEPAEDTKDLEVYRKTIRELKQQNASLKQAHCDADREARTVREKLAEQEETWEAERQELIHLRELVYRQAQEIEKAAPAEKEISFPCSTAHRMVAFGGRDSWLKTIRPMLPDVRFAGTQPNADLIRHADMVWIQPNGLSHEDFCKLINAARTHHIPIFYFSCASAAKCAEELVRVDIEEPER